MLDFQTLVSSWYIGPHLSLVEVFRQGKMAREVPLAEKLVEKVIQREQSVQSEVPLAERCPGALV